MSLHEGSPSAAATAGYARGRALADVAGSWLRSRHALLPMVDADDLAARFGALACEEPNGPTSPTSRWAPGTCAGYGAAEALTRVRDGIRRLNVSIGGANTESSGYHETVTAAYITLLAEFLEACPPGLPLAECLARLWTTPLAERDMLFTFYSREHLCSTGARARWVNPDLAPLRLEVVTGGDSRETQAETACPSVRPLRPVP